MVSPADDGIRYGPAYPREEDGHTYYRMDGEWAGAPTYVLGYHKKSEGSYVIDFYLSADERASLESWLATLAGPP